MWNQKQPNGSAVSACECMHADTPIEYSISVRRSRELVKLGGECHREMGIAEKPTSLPQSFYVMRIFQTHRKLEKCCN